MEKHTGNDWYLYTVEFASLMAEFETQAALHAEGELEHAGPTIEDEHKAEAHLRAMAYWQAQLAGIRAHADAEIDRIQQWANTEGGKLERKLLWHTKGLKAFCWASGAKTIRLIAGTLKRTKGRDRIEIADETAFVAAAAPEFVRTKIIREPDKKAIMASVKATGEIPDGVDIVTAEDTFQVVLPGKPETEWESDVRPHSINVPASTCPRDGAWRPTMTERGGLVTQSTATGSSSGSGPKRPGCSWNGPE